MNRRGRAICRIMFAHGWSYKAIAYIFRISETSVQRAVENKFYRPPVDRIEEDLERAGPEWRGELPPPIEDGRPKVLKAKAGGVLASLQQVRNALSIAYLLTRVEAQCDHPPRRIGRRGGGASRLI
jgi:hypothetical protein